MTLSANAPRDYSQRGYESALPTQAVVTYAGGALTADSNGDVGPLATSETFAGFALEKVDNSGGSAGDKNIRVLTEGVIELTVTGVDDANDYGVAVYATDDNTFTTTSSGGLQIGKVEQVTDGSNNKALVHFQSASRRSV